MRKTTSRVLWILVGVLLVITGIACFAHPAATLGSLAILLGIAMLFSGVVDLVIFATARDAMYGSGWFLLDGVLTILLSIFILGNAAFTMVSLPFIVGMWLVFSGTSRMVNSFDLRRMGVKGWGWFTGAGVVLMIAGFISFLYPVAGALILTWLVGFLGLHPPRWPGSPDVDAVTIRSHSPVQNQTDQHSELYPSFTSRD